ncbi:hypothetical protein D3C78_1223620 [compost metagenome]
MTIEGQQGFQLLAMFQDIRQIRFQVTSVDQSALQYLGIFPEQVLGDPDIAAETAATLVAQCPIPVA